MIEQLLIWREPDGSLEAIRSTDPARLNRLCQEHRAAGREVHVLCGFDDRERYFESAWTHQYEKNRQEESGR